MPFKDFQNRTLSIPFHLWSKNKTRGCRRYMIFIPRNLVLLRLCTLQMCRFVFGTSLIIYTSPEEIKVPE